MGLLEQLPIKAGSVYAAALEQRGATLQSRMLEVFSPENLDGQMLAGALFTIAIALGIGTIAIGGRYLWARYLLIGPVLFMFLTQVTVPFSETKWQFGDHEFPEGHKEKLLRSLENGTTEGGEGTRVSMFFQFWNVFMAELNSTLLANLNVTKDGSHLNIIKKVERYMHFTTMNFIEDPYLREFIRMALISECAHWYRLSLMAANPTVDLADQGEYQTQAKEAGDELKYSMSTLYTAKEDKDHLSGWLEERGFDTTKVYSCQGLWDKVVEITEKELRPSIIRELSRATAPTEKKGQVFNAFVKKLFTETNRAAQRTELTLVDSGNPGFEDDVDQLLQNEHFGEGLRRAIDWVVAQSLFYEIWRRDRFADNINFDRGNFHGIRATGMGADPNVQDIDATTGNAIEQFNRPEKFQFKGDFVNAAMAMPQFQGVLLMLLSATYPLFALAVILPGRAGAILSWMGLWAWVRMWDIGFGVVVMIDNILYALFPRGPSLEEGDKSNPGLVWQRIMEIDPNYASATYYNIIAACLFAVPLATAVFVKGAGNELINASHSRWQQMATRLAGSAATFKHSMQAQGYAGRMEMEKFEAGARAMFDMQESAGYQKLRDEKDKVDTLHAAIESSKIEDIRKKATGLIGGSLSGLKKKQIATKLEERSKQIGRVMDAMTENARVEAEYGVTNGSFGFWSSESAVASRYFSHDFTSDHPYKSQIALDYAKRTYDRDSVIKNLGDAGVNKAAGAIGAAGTSRSSSR